MIDQALKKIGLEDKEIRVYVTLLEVGLNPASTVAYRIDMPRNTARFILDNLVKMGLVNKVKKGNTQLYAPENPKNVIKFLEMKRNKMSQKIDEQIQGFQEVMTEIQTKITHKGNRPKVTMYEGEEGLLKVYEDTLTSSGEIRSFASFDGMHGALPEYFKTYYQRRVENGIFIRSIHPDSKLSREKAKNDQREWRESALIPSEKYNFEPEIQIYDNKINIVSWSENVALIIESQEIYKALSVAFELAWKEAKRCDSRKKK